MSNRLRVASLQYFIRPVATFRELGDQVAALVHTAADYRCNLVVFPEWFTVQLLTLGDTRRPMPEQIRWLAGYADEYIALFTRLARDTGMYIVGGTTPVAGEGDGVIHNVAHLFGPDGNWGTQPKLHMTRFEAEEWNVSPEPGLHVFDTGIGRLAIAICYDVEFPEVARAAAHAGADYLIVPSCTDDRQGFLRVRYCAQARAIENQMYVVMSSTVGSLPSVPAVHLNYGQAAMFTPSDFQFARDGILAEGNINQEMMVIAELDLEKIQEFRTEGTVLPLRDSISTSAMIGTVEVTSV